MKSIVDAADTKIYNVLNSVRAIEEFSKYLYDELEKMIRALEIYIAEFVQNIPVEMKSKRGEEGYNWQSYEILRRELEVEYDAQHPKHELYIFGHSLDVTDKDILRELLLNDNVHTTIFYCKKKDHLGLEIMPIYC